MNRRSRTSMLMIVAVLVIGSAIATGLLFGLFQAQRLAYLSHRHLETVSEISDKTADLLRSNYLKTLPDAVGRAMTHHLRELHETEQSLRRKLTAHLDFMSSPIVLLVSPISKSALAESRSNLVQRDLIEQVRLLATPPNLNDPHRNRELLITLHTGALVIGPKHRHEILFEAINEAIWPLAKVLAILAIAILAGLLSIWRFALWPALNKIERDAREISGQNLLLARRDRLLASAQNIARLGYWVADTRQHLELSPELTKMIRTRTSSAIGTLEALAGDDKDEAGTPIIRHYRTILENGGDLEFTRAYETADGVPITIRERISAQGDGTDRSLMGVWLDITEVARAQTIIARMERLEYVRSIVSAVAHDFNNMLAVIRAYVDLVRLRPEQAQKAIDHIGRTTSNAASLVSQLQMAANDPRTMAVDFDIVTSVKELYSSADVIGDANVSIDFGFEADRPQIVHANRGLFENAVLNLLKNAIEASEPGGSVEIRTGVENGDISDSGVAFVEIRDFGAGMSEATLARATEPFFTTKTNSDQSIPRGLGLWSVQVFLAASGGDLKVSSCPGQGTTVRLTLPTVANSTVTTSGAVDDVETTHSAHKRPCILLVEDNDALRNVIKEQLELLGCDVMLADGFDEAQKIISSEAELDLLLSDVSLGAGRSGIDLARLAAQARDNLKITFMSGSYRSSDQGFGSFTKDVEWLVKPVSLEALKRTISRVQ